MPSHLFESLAEGRLKIGKVAEGYSDIAMIEDTLPMALGDVVVPTIQLPPKPPPARTGYWSGSVGGFSAASALNFSNVGIFNNEIVSRCIVRVNYVIISNFTGAVSNTDIRRADPPITGFTFLNAVPMYVDAGTAGDVAIGRLLRNNAVTAEGVFVTTLTLPDLTMIKVPINAVINNGAIICSGDVINKAVSAAFFFDVYPILHTQQSG